MISHLRTLLSRVRSSFAMRKLDDDFTQELESHFDLLTQQNIRKGMSPEEARRVARLKLGSEPALRETHHDQRTIRWLESFGQDLRFAFRMLRKNPGFTVVAVLTLALGIGTNTAIFSLVNGILLKPLPYANPSQLVELSSSVQIGKMLFFGGLSPEYLDAIRAGCPTFTGVAGYSLAFFTMIADSTPDRVSGAKVSPELFSLLGVQTLLGRPILPSDTTGTRGDVAVLSYDLWRASFAADPNAVGRIVLLDSKAYTIVGVMPPQFEFPPEERGIWIPLAANEGMSAAIARLAQGTTRNQAAVQLKVLASRLRPDAKRWSITPRRLDESLNKLRVELPILFAAVVFILLIACVNVSALLLSVGASRAGEVAVREALGASRSRICRQLLTESLLLSVFGGVAALIFAPSSIRIVRLLAPPNMAGIENVRLDANVLWFALAVSLLSAIAFGLAPALRLSRSGDLTKFRQGLARTSLADRGSRRLQHVLVALELALSVVLAVGAALLVRSFNRLLSVHSGFRTDHVISMQISFTGATCPNPAACTRTEQDALERLRSIPKVSSVAFGSGLPLYSGTDVSETLQIEGQPKQEVLAEGMHIAQRSVSPDYFQVLGIPLLIGRTFGPDESASSNNILINESFARRYFSSSPVGKRVSFRDDYQGNPVWSEIIGVVGDTHDSSLDKPAAIEFYHPFAQVMYGSNPETLILRSTIDPTALLPTIRQKVWSIDKNAPITHVSTMDQIVADSVAEPRFRVALLGTFGTLGLFLAMVGTYGVVSYAVAHRTHEIGVRVALGAGRKDVLKLVLRQGMSPALSGIAIGVVGAFGLTRFLNSFLFGVAPTDPATFASVAVFITLTALCACYVPARRATKVDPMEALRHE